MSISGGRWVMGGRGERVTALEGFGRAHWAGMAGRGASSSREKKVDWYGHSSSFSERDVVDCDAEWMRYTILDGRTEGIPASSSSSSMRWTNLSETWHC